MVKITPAANDSPADAAVWTILFSNIFDFLNSDKTPMEMTAAGIEAETVIPAKSPKYALAPARIMESKIPRNIDFTVISGSGFDMIFLNYYSGKIVIFAWENIREILNFGLHRGAVLNPDKTAENKPI